MGRMFTAEIQPRGQALRSFGAYACLPGRSLDHEAKPARREAANIGSPDVRW